MIISTLNGSSGKNRGLDKVTLTSFALRIDRVSDLDILLT